MINEPIHNIKNWENKCIICYNKINVNKDKYVKLSDMNGKKVISHCVYHLNCWHNRFAVTSEKMNEMANEWINKITEFAKGEKVVEIK